MICQWRATPASHDPAAEKLRKTRKKSGFTAYKCFFWLYITRALMLLLNFGRFPAGKTTGKTNQATERGSTYAGITLILEGARDRGRVMAKAGFEQLTVYRMPVVQNFWEDL